LIVAVRVSGSSCLFFNNKMTIMVTPRGYVIAKVVTLVYGYMKGPINDWYNAACRFCNAYEQRKILF
jgi:hypothetical protein